MMESGYLAFVLHAHLPFVRHPEYTDSFEEDWLFEAITETYLPLLKVFEELLADGIKFRVTMVLTPTLMEMLSDDLLQTRYIKHLERLMELAEREVERTRNQPHFRRIARMYLVNFHEAYHRYTEIYRRDLVGGLARIRDTGCLELMASAATHGFLPLLNMVPATVQAQIGIGINNFRKHLGRNPDGFWLPECGYAPELDRVLADWGVRYTIVDTHGLIYARPRPRYGVFAPVMAPAKITVFGRDLESSKQVWSSHQGYPGDPDYREFYRDAGFDLDFDYIHPYIHESGQRISTGIKYYRITGPGDDKQPYDPERAEEKAQVHAQHFIEQRRRQVGDLCATMDRNPIMLAPYDAELFGHWWYEGPSWLNRVIRLLAQDEGTVIPINPSEFLQQYPTTQVCQPNMSSWGYRGYYEVWLEESNDWIYPHLHLAGQRMVEMAADNANPAVLERRALNQAARELLLAQSSDWAFIMKTGTTVEYAQQRTRDHLTRFNRLYDEIGRGEINAGWLAEIENRDNLFPEMDYRIYAPRK